MKIIFLLIISISFFGKSVAQHVQILVSPAECITCSKNFQNLNQVDGQKFFVFGDRFQKDLSRIERRIKPLLNYQNIIISNAIEASLIKESQAMSNNIFVYNKTNQLALKLHYNDLTKEMVLKINKILEDDDLGKQPLKRKHNDILYEWNKELHYFTIQKKDTSIEIGKEIFQYQLLQKHLDITAGRALEDLHKKYDPMFLVEQINLIHFDIDKYGNLNIFANYPTYSVDEKNTIYNQSCVMQVDTNGSLIEILPINYDSINGAKSFSLVSGDSLAFVIATGFHYNNIKNTERYITKYKRQNKEYKHEGYLPVHYSIFNESFMQGNFLTLYRSQYPYFVSELSQHIYNAQTQQYLSVIDSVSYLQAFEACRTLMLTDSSKEHEKMRKCASNYYVVSQLGYDASIDLLYVIYKNNNETQLKVFQKDVLIGQYNLFDFFAKSDTNAWYFDFINQRISKFNYQTNKTSSLPISFFYP